MKIASVRIQNFRGFRDETIQFNDYTCLVGENGAGKSTVLNALNVFFQEQDGASTDTKKLTAEDFTVRDTSEPIEITVTFTKLSDAAKQTLAAYVRADQLVVTAKASFDEEQQEAEVKHFGQRLGMEKFKQFFEAVKRNAKKTELDKIYGDIQATYTDLPPGKSKDAKVENLQEYEAERPEECTLLPSEDNFYGYQGSGKLSKFIQYVYVPAVKHATDEERETKDSAIGRLVDRVVRSKTDFDERLTQLRDKTLDEYKTILADNRSGLDELSKTLQDRLQSWAHPSAKVQMDWVTDEKKSVQVTSPVAGLSTGDGAFAGSLARMGHGLQRSYLLALMQELAETDDSSSPTLVLACEEPELYQHPPQARYLADVFEQLTEKTSQIVVTTHSPYFVKGDALEAVRLVRCHDPKVGAKVTQSNLEKLCRTLEAVRGKQQKKNVTGIIAKIHQAIQPHIAEMLFCRVPILVEGLEDAAYITSKLHVSGRWMEFRRLGCHIVPVNGKDNLILPIALAAQLAIPVFVMMDCDGDQDDPERRKYHESDNAAIFALMDVKSDAIPSATVFADGLIAWAENMTKEVVRGFGDSYRGLSQQTNAAFGHEGSLKKHELFVADLLQRAEADGCACECLDQLCDAILDHAKRMR